jgi:hypothetical protein
MKGMLRTVAAAVGLSLSISPVTQAQFKLPSIPSIPNPLQKPAGGASTAGVVGVCALVGTGGAFLGKALAEKDAKRLKLTSAQTSQRATSYMLGFGLLGCAVGGGVAAAVINHMTASAKQAQDTAWQQAQAGTSSVEWKDPNSSQHGKEELAERELADNGQECGTRRSVIDNEEGEANPLMRVCRSPPATEWKPVTVAS